MPPRIPRPPAPDPAVARWGPEAFPEALRPYLLEIREQYLPWAGGPPHRFALSATTTPNLNVALEGGGTVVLPRELGGGTVPLDPFCLAPPMAHPFSVEVDGPVRGLDVLFHPVGPFALLGVRAYGLSERGVPPLEHVVRPDLRAAVQAWRRAVLAPLAPWVMPEAAFAARARRIVDFLAERVVEVPAESALLARAVALIEEAEGNMRVEDLARALGMSRPTLRRRFRVLGLPVKQFAQVVRFRHVHAFLAAAPGTPWVDVAHRFGYADQSHLVREHRRFSGVSPTHWGDDDRLFDALVQVRAPQTPRSDGAPAATFA